MLAEVAFAPCRLWSSDLPKQAWIADVPWISLEHVSRQTTAVTICLIDAHLGHECWQDWVAENRQCCDSCIGRRSVIPNSGSIVGLL